MVSLKYIGLQLGDSKIRIVLPEEFLVRNSLDLAEQEVKSMMIVHVDNRHVRMCLQERCLNYEISSNL
jgi:hypothetical protein